MVSGAMGRESNSFDKMGQFEHEKYHGVIFGTGDGNTAMEIIEWMAKLENDTLEGFVEAIKGQHSKVTREEYRAWMQAAYDDARLRSMLIQDEKEREEYMNRQKSEISSALEKYKRDSRTYFRAVAFDKDAKRIRKFHIDANYCREITSHHVEIGSGSDAANLYFSAVLQGVDPKKLTDVADLAYFAANAYSMADVNSGVGGVPKMAHIRESGCTIVGPRKTKAIANVSGAHSARYNEAMLTSSGARAFLGAILGNDEPEYGQIAGALGICVNTLTTVYVPFSSWQERANADLFPNGKPNK
jgi:hypothetical protein